VRNIAGVLLCVFVFLGLIQGLVAGDMTAMTRRVALDMPAAVLGMVATTVVVAKLLELTDALSAAVLTQSGSQAVHFLTGFGVSAKGAAGGFAAVLLGSVAVIAGLLLWIELMVRSVLVYIIVALSPLSFAAMVWPSTRSTLRRTIELLAAVVVSKLVICIAISVGVAALAGAGTAAPNGPGTDSGLSASMGTLFVGTAVLVIAAFAPFLVLKLIPWAEAAVVAHGVSGAPVRAANTTVWTANSASSIARLAGATSPGASPYGSGRSETRQMIGAPVNGSAKGATAVGSALGPVGAAGNPVTATVVSTGTNGAWHAVETTTEAAAAAATVRSEPEVGTSTRDVAHTDRPPPRPTPPDTPRCDEAP